MVGLAKSNTKSNPKGRNEKTKRPFSCLAPTTGSGAWDLYSHSHHTSITNCDQIQPFKLDPPNTPTFKSIMLAQAHHKLSVRNTTKK